MLDESSVEISSAKLAANLPTLHDYNHAALKNYLLSRIAAPHATTESAKSR